MILFHEGVFPAASKSENKPVLVSQNLFRADDRHKMVEGVQVELGLAVGRRTTWRGRCRRHRCQERLVPLVQFLGQPLAHLGAGSGEAASGEQFTGIAFHSMGQPA